MRIPATILAAALLFSCTSEPEPEPAPADTLDCAWLASETSNCWKTTLAAAASCLPEQSTQGTLSTDGTTCTFADGKAVAFDPPMELPPTAKLYKFTITSGGKDCLTFEKADGQLGDSTKLTTAAGTVEESVAGFNIGITCPDKKAYTASNGLGLMSCKSDAGSSFGGLPGVMWSSGGTSVSYSLMGGPNGSSVSLFSCSKK